MRAGAVIAALALVAAACGDDDDGGGAEPPATTDATDTTEPAEGTTTTEAAPTGDGCTAERVGGEVTMGIWSETRSLDPVVSTGSGTTGGTELSAIFDTLMRFNPDTAAFEPWVAESLEPNDDYRVWTLTLRPDVTFGNGDPLTAEAVQASIDRHRDPESSSTVRPEASQIESMEVLDEHTLEITLVEPWGTFPFLLAEMAGMITNPAVLDELGEEDFGGDPQGGGVGPYRVVTWSPGEELVLEARDDYWAGPVCLERLRFVDLGDEASTYEALQAGEIDVAYFREPQSVAQAREDGFSVLSEIVGLGLGLLINNNVGDPVTQDVRVRQAVAHAVEPGVLSERAVEGAMIESTTIMPETSPYHPGIEGPTHDPDRAAELVEEVVEETGWDGSIRLWCSQSVADQGLALEAMLNAVGFEVQQQAFPTSEFAQRVYVDRDYDLACGGAGASDASPWVRLERFYGAANFFTGYADDDFHAALDDLKAAPGPDEAQPVMRELQEIWNDTIPSVGLGALELAIVYRDGVHDIEPNVNMMASFARAYVED